MNLQSDWAVQAGTPMALMGDVSLSPWLGTERLLCRNTYSIISRGAMISLPIEVGQRPFCLSIGRALI
jgi:hypothetical protein